MLKSNFVDKGGTAFAGLRRALLELHFQPEDLEKCRVVLEVPTRWHSDEIIMRLRQDAVAPFNPVPAGAWFGIPFEIKVKDAR